MQEKKHLEVEILKLIMDLEEREASLFLQELYHYKDILQEGCGVHLSILVLEMVVEFLDVLLETTGFSKDSLHVRIWERFSGVVLMEMRLVVVQLLLEDINQE